MIYGSLSRRLPGFLRRHVLHFETAIEESTARFAESLPAGSRVLDAGAGELRYANLFSRHRYVAVDLAIGDPAWNYGRLDCIADLTALPLASASCDACINIVTLEHVREPARVLSELGRVLRPGARIFLVAPHEWEVHQAPHDYFRYTCHGLRMLLEGARFEAIEIEPVGGYFRLLSRRLLNGLQFFPGPLFFVAALFLAPSALLLPFLDGLDRRRDFTLGYICTARKESTHA
ncbi:MAG: methyltransferase domain-containing protein [Bryobacteraceae bacterium]